jgi:hypothetical protein
VCLTKRSMTFRVIQGKHGRGPKHIPIPLVWSFVHAGSELTREQCSHLNECVHCMEVFKYCVIYENVDAVEQELTRSRKESA